MLSNSAAIIFVKILASLDILSKNYVCRKQVQPEEHL